MSFTKEKTFWLLQISGWTVFYFQHLFVLGGITDYSMNAMLNKTSSWLIGFLISIGLRYRFKRINYFDYSFLSLSIIIFLYSFIASAIWEVCALLLLEVVTALKVSMEETTVRNVIVGIFRNNVIFIGWSGLYFGIKFWMEWVSEKQKTDRALLLARDAQFEMLRYQLNPHFLFNTLSSLRALISDDNEKAKEIITKISEFLRYTLIETDHNEVPLSEEMDVIRNYLDIEKVRFEEELMVEFNIDPAAEAYPIPIFLIHPLVENAIKHGMQTSPIPLKIVITAHMQGDALQVSVLNSGRWTERSEHKTTGRGLENVKRRLEIYAPNHHAFDVIKNTDSILVTMSMKKRIN